MTDYYTDKVASSIPARGAGPDLVAQSATLTISTALANSDIVQLFKVPAGAVVHYLSVASDGTQSGNNSTFSVGDGDDDDRFLAAASGTSLRTGGGAVVCNRYVGLNHQYTADDTIDLKVVEQGAGQTTGGKIRASIIYSGQP